MSSSCLQVLMGSVPDEIISIIMEYADMDARIAMGCIQRLDDSRVEFLENKIRGRPMLWNNDVMEWMLILRVSAKCQYVRTINMQTPYHVSVEHHIVYFQPYSHTFRLM